MLSNLYLEVGIDKNHIFHNFKFYVFYVVNIYINEFNDNLFYLLKKKVFSQWLLW